MHITATRTVSPQEASASASNDDIAKWDVALAAAREIQWLPQALQPHIANMDDTGDIYPVTRGAVIRVSGLANAILTVAGEAYPGLSIRPDCRRALRQGGSDP